VSLYASQLKKHVGFPIQKITVFIQFINGSTCTFDIQIMYEDKQIHTAIETKFIGLFNTLPWKTHTEYIKSKLSSVVSQTICITKYSENDLLFLLPLCNDLWFTVLGTLLRQYKDFQVAKEDY